MNKMMNSKRWPLLALAGLLLALAAGLAACAPASSEPKPPEIAYGRDMCDACGMIISEARFAAAILLTDGKTLKFDDAGEMFSYHAKNPALNIRVWFVHDYDSQAWINGQSAFYVMHSDLHTPMGTGIAAFANKAGADALANRLNAQVMTFDQVQAANPMPAKKGM